MKEYLQTRTWVFDGMNAYFCTNINSAFWKLDMESGEARILSSFDNVKNKDFVFYLKLENDFYFFSDWGNVILKYNLNSGKTKYINVDNRITLGIFNAFSYNNLIYAVSIRHGKIYKIDTELNIIDEIFLYEKEFSPLWMDSCIEGNKIYVCGGAKKEIIIYDIENSCVLRKTVNIDDNICTIGLSGEYIYIGGDKRDILYKCIDNGMEIVVVDSIILSDFNYHNRISSFHKIICNQNYCIIIPRSLPSVYCCRYDEKKRLTVKKLIDNKTKMTSKKSGERYGFLYMNNNGNLGVVDKIEGMYIEIDVEESEIFKRNLIFDMDDYKKVYSKLYNYNESREINLKDFFVFLNME